jgi:hypothetical protein
MRLLIPVSNSSDRNSEALMRAAQRGNVMCVAALMYVSPTEKWSPEQWDTLDSASRAMLGAGPGTRDQPRRRGP